MKIEINKCKVCPFFDDGNDGYCVRHNCTHPSAKHRDIEVYRSDWDGWNAKEGSPEWCPLKKETLVIAFNSKAKL